MDPPVILLPRRDHRELIKVIKTEEKVCNYIDMPIQHSENRILQRMGRRTSREDLVAVIKKLRKEIPDITIRTTLITGFPGESQEDHEGLMNFVEECQFDRLGVFTYFTGRRYTGSNI